jgi:hypothetical protein
MVQEQMLFAIVSFNRTDKQPKPITGRHSVLRPSIRGHRLVGPAAEQMLIHQSDIPLCNIGRSDLQIRHGEQPVATR